MAFYIAQAISVLNALTAVLIMQCKNMKIILIGHIATNLLTASTYFLLDSFSGAGICVIAIVQTVIMFFYNRKNVKPHIPVILGFIVLYIGCSVLYYKSPIDILSALAAVTFAISVTQEKPSVSRFWYLFNPLLWMVYDIYAKAYVNFVMHTAIFISTFWAMIRVDRIFDRKNKA